MSQIALSELPAERHRRLFESIEPEADPIVVPGGRYASITFLRTGKSTSGRYLLAKVLVPPHAGPPPHLHHWTDEWFYTPDGGAVMFMGQRHYRDIDLPPDKAGKDALTLVPMEKGDLIFGPRYSIHGYVNATDHPITVYIVWTPDTPDVSVIDYFVDSAKAVFRDDALNSETSPIHAIRYVAMARKYGMHFSSDFWQYASEVNEDPHAKHSEFARLERLIHGVA